MVKIWCVPISILDRQRLLGEHVELHIIFNALHKQLKGIKGGWQHHPETLRFKNHLGMLYDRHRQQVQEMQSRGYNHKSPLPELPHTPEEYDYTRNELARDIRTLEERKGLKIPKEVK